MRRWLFAGILAFGTGSGLACSSEGPVDLPDDLGTGTPDARTFGDDGGPRDASAEDGPLPGVDASFPDAAPTDAGSSDAWSLDGAADDATGPDSGGADAGSADAVPADAAGLDASGADARPLDATVADAATPDASGRDAAAADASSPVVPTYRNSLSVCWTDATCPRKLAIAHGGQWSLSTPYNSNAAIEDAYANGLDGVKIDVRVTRDNVPVIAHSSPIEIYESWDCRNKKIEEMTAAEVTQCHRLPSQSETFQRLDDVLNDLRGKMVVQLTVKVQADFARAIAEVITLGAQDYAFFEVKTPELQNLIPAIPGSNQVYYLINIGGAYAEIDTVINLSNPRAFMIEMDPSAQTQTLVTTRIHPAGMRAFTYNDSTTASVSTLEALYTQGFDVVSAQEADNCKQARINVNQANGVSPP